MADEISEKYIKNDQWMVDLFFFFSFPFPISF